MSGASRVNRQWNRSTQKHLGIDQHNTPLPSFTHKHGSIIKLFLFYILITYHKVIDPCGYIQCMQVCQQVNIMTNNSTVQTVNIR